LCVNQATNSQNRKVAMVITEQIRRTEILIQVRTSSGEEIIFALIKFTTKIRPAGFYSYCILEEIWTN
jgi:hypothetical protein